MDSYDLALIRELQAQVAQLQQNVGMLQLRVERLQKQAADADVRSTVVLDVLTESGQLDTQEIQARISAALIARQHQIREELADSQSAWDALGSKKDQP